MQSFGIDRCGAIYLSSPIYSPCSVPGCIAKVRHYIAANHQWPINKVVPEWEDGLLLKVLYWGQQSRWKDYAKEDMKPCLPITKKLPHILMNRRIRDPYVQWCVRRIPPANRWRNRLYDYAQDFFNQTIL